MIRRFALQRLSVQAARRNLSGWLFDSKCSLKRGNVQLGISVDKMGHLSDSCVTGSAGGSVVHVAVNSQAAAEASEDFLPLTVDYRARMSAFGLIPDNVRRRELPSDDETLVARFIDRAVRPLFPSGFVEEVQITVTNHATDGIHDPTVLALNATSLALLKSKQPWVLPIGCVRVGLIDGAVVINPPVRDMEKSTLDLLYAGTKDRTVMIEAVGSQVPESTMNQAILAAHEAVADVIDHQLALLEQLKDDASPVRVGTKLQGITLQEEHKQIVHDLYYEQALALYRSSHSDFKEDRSKAEGVLRSTIISALEQHSELSGQSKLVQAMLTDQLISKAFRQVLLEDPPIRSDGRSVTNVRNISCAADVLPSVHGSAYFARGDTHVLSTVTLGPMLSCRESVAIDGSNNEKKDYFFLHYDFPPYCNGEVGLLGSNRRMIGHGNLAERALRAVMPPFEKFPYSVRVVAECTSSNGSSSMASACSGSLALTEAGVPLQAPVAGVSIGLVTDPSFATSTAEDGKYNLLVDILGSEDHHGDMDFKIAGSSTGITAMQLDVKLAGGIPLKIIQEAVISAKSAREHILSQMAGAVSRTELKDNSPRAALVKIDEKRMEHVVKNGGEVPKFIRNHYQVELDVDAKECKAYLYAKPGDIAGFSEALSLLEAMATTMKEGRVINATIADVKDFGLFVRLNEGQEALLHVTHVSEDPRLAKLSLEELFTVGSKIDVKVTSVDDVTGLITVSRRVLQDKASTDPIIEHYLKTGKAKKAAAPEASSARAEGTLSSLQPLTAKFPMTPPRYWSPDFFRHSVASEKDVQNNIERGEQVRKGDGRRSSGSSGNNRYSNNSNNNNNRNGNHSSGKQSGGNSSQHSRRNDDSKSTHSKRSGQNFSDRNSKRDDAAAGSQAPRPAESTPSNEHQSSSYPGVNAKNFTVV